MPPLKLLPLDDEPSHRCWQNIIIEYKTEKKAHYGGTIREPLISRNPYNGQEVIRYIEAFNEDNESINPMQVHVASHSVSESERFLRQFTQRLYQDDVMYLQIRMTKRDYVIITAKDTNTARPQVDPQHTAS